MGLGSTATVVTIDSKSDEFPDIRSLDGIGVG